MSKKEDKVETTATTEETTATTATPKETSYRTFHIVQYERNPETGEDLHFSETNIIKALKHRSIKRYAYICHDHDVKEDGSPKGLHWHIAIDVRPALTVTKIAEWFDIPKQYVGKVHGKGGFLDVVEYLTHEKAKGKYVYDEKLVHSNFDWRAALQARADELARYGQLDLDERHKQRLDVLLYGKTLRECKADNADLFVTDMQTLKKCRQEYLNATPVPEQRINFYVSGSGGIGKGFTCEALARALFPNIKNDEDLFFTVGAGNVLFEGYDGQPVIIWNDRRAIDLLVALDSRENVFNLFDTHPKDIMQNVKFAAVKLTNVVNIVNSVQPYHEFLDALSGEYTDKHGNTYKSEESEKSQSYRRFPFGITVKSDCYTLESNNGFILGDPGLYTDLYCQTYKGSAVAAYRHYCKRDREELVKVDSRLFASLVETYNKCMETGFTSYDSDSDFDDFGEIA